VRVPILALGSPRQPIPAVLGDQDAAFGAVASLPRLDHV
jgi:hypothetical protein